jgi:hypothetical protein
MEIKIVVVEENYIEVYNGDGLLFVFLETSKEDVEEILRGEIKLTIIGELYGL